MFCRKKQSPSTFLSLKMQWKTQLCWHHFFSLFEKFKWRRSMQFILLNTQLSYPRLYWTSYIYAKKVYFISSFIFSKDKFWLQYARNHYQLLIRNRSWILAIHKDRIFWKNLLENKVIVFKNGIKIYKPWLIMMRVQ